ncbi:PucR family transcriptional regulator ligand-binding domain-containing protein [Microbacterium ulmi]|uniref:PucR family transcriptional regulator n=1 Tax=Microbacterium ulmi TaxID=179095 RepID=A0A7Y2LYE7_9MICO|nr:purine catabolism regulator [Microbacterium ulmi]NNH03052.1 PucR family transcriptional regulator [Microbacterium ulmi]
MAVTLRQLLEETELELRCVAGAAELDREIRWVHVSEVADPTPWLQGGEFLITTGLQLSTPASMMQYMERLADRGISGVGFGTGGTVHAPYGVVPPAIVEAGEQRGIPVIEVPIDVPFVAVSQFVTTRLASEQFATVQRAYDIQRQLTSAALEPRGRAEVLRLLAAATGSQVAVLSIRGTVLDASPGAAAERYDALRADLERASTQGAVAQIIDDEGAVTAIHPLGTRRRTRQLLVVTSTRAPTPLERMVVTGAVTLLSIDAERRLGFSPERQMASDRLGALALRQGATTRDRIDALAALGFPARASVTVASLRIPGAVGAGIAGGVNDILFDRAVPSVFVARATPEAPFVLIAALSPVELSDVVGEVFRELARRGGQAGVSASHRIGELVVAAQESAAALRHAEHSRVPLQRYEEMLLHSVVLDAIPEDRRASVADAVLARLDEAADPALADALAAFLQHNGHITRASAALGLHRQTLVKRLDAVERLLGVSLDSPDDRSALWVALSARSMPR